MIKWTPNFRCTQMSFRSRGAVPRTIERSRGEPKKDHREASKRSFLVPTAWSAWAPREKYLEYGRHPRRSERLKIVVRSAGRFRGCLESAALIAIGAGTSKKVLERQLWVLVWWLRRIGRVRLRCLKGVEGVKWNKKRPWEELTSKPLHIITHCTITAL